MPQEFEGAFPPPDIAIVEPIDIGVMRKRLAFIYGTIVKFPNDAVIDSSINRYFASFQEEAGPDPSPSRISQLAYREVDRRQDAIAEELSLTADKYPVLVKSAQLLATLLLTGSISMVLPYMDTDGLTAEKVASAGSAYVLLRLLSTCTSGLSDLKISRRDQFLKQYKDIQPTTAIADMEGMREHMKKEANLLLSVGRRRRLIRRATALATLLGVVGFSVLPGEHLDQLFDETAAAVSQQPAY